MGGKLSARRLCAGLERHSKIVQVQATGEGVAMNIGGILMLWFIGSLPNGEAAQAAFAVGYSQLFLLVTWSSNGLMGASAAVAGQNLGAGHPDRSNLAVHAAARIGLAVAA